ncbi:MAG: class I SAM-dependent methyltransferase [Bdellovibrionales bacterium]|nr:class I SAM-dependent methyltransferase [Bdellovibrionales bacterium]
MKDYYEHEFRYDDIETSENKVYFSLFDTVELPEGETILDIGCGNGASSIPLINSRSRYIGADFAFNPLSYAKQHFPQELWVNCSGEALPFSDGLFDKIFFMGSLEHFPNISKGISEAIRCLKGNGTIYILVPNKYFPPFLLTGGTTQPQELLLSLANWKKLLAKNGLTTVSVGYDRGRNFSTRSVREFLRWFLIKLFNYFPLSLRYQFFFECKVDARKLSTS